MKKGHLYLIPNIIAEGTENDVISSRVKTELLHIEHFLAEDIRTARRYLKSLGTFDSIERLQFQLLNKDTSQAEIKALFDPIFAGLDIGVVSDSGCPGVADPGALAVRFAHNNDITVIPLVGPSSILLALMGSGLNGQRFSFYGYLPIDAKESARVIHELEKESRQKNQTQLFIETPYRSNALFQHLINNLHEETIISIAVDLTSANEVVKAHPVKKWKRLDMKLPKAPVVFSFLAN
ncbi:MAG: SAM-dependent methyltransferase [Chryseolinea sp.]